MSESDVTDAAKSPGISWLAADWGTSSLRVWAMDGGGRVLASATSGRGMGRLTTAEYEDALLELAGTWLPPESADRIPVLVCGMAGAKQGWQEAGYARTPCPPVASTALTRVTVKDPRLEVFIVAGICQISPPDVMRGEETQLAGLTASGVLDGTVCMPGTHSKWVRLARGRIEGFATFMTGELFAAITQHTILRHSLVEGNGFDSKAFLAGVGQGLEGSSALAATLFSIRASGLLGQDGGDASSRISGLLIGTELAANRALWEAGETHLVGDTGLVENYALAIRTAGGHPVVHDGEALVLAGLRQVRAAILESAA
jgi:2-dehydro-3-deoxygalactonokinase